MRFQKILALVSLIIAALTIVLAIIFMSGNLANIMYYAGNEDASYDVTPFTDPAQKFCDIMLIVGIVYICCVVTLFITDTNKRRNYYITNYVSTGIAVAGAVAASAIGIIMIAILMGKFYGLDWELFKETIEDLSEIGGKDVSQSPTMFIVGIVMSILPLLDAAALILNLVWKIKLMKGEKALLEKGFEKEVA